MGIPFCVICCFSLAAFNICFLCLIFVNLINMCLGVFHLGFILFGILWVSWTWVIISFPILGKFSTIISSSPRNLKSPKQDKPKAKHPKTHINQINKEKTQRTNIKSSKGKTTNNTQGNSHKDNS